MEEKRIDFLKERAREFFEEAKELLKKKRYNLSAFNLEQAIQLFVKYLIGKKLGDWPKTHYLSELVPDLVKVYKNKKILKFYRENELFFENLEDAYFVSRYFPKKFSENSLLQLFEKSEEFLELVKNEIKESLYG
jgi:HEPN domain-containing protein